MEEDVERPYVIKATEKSEFPSKVVRAGKRTYFFDIRTNPEGEFYLTITESKRIINDDGTRVFEKHKIYLFNEDFGLFAGGLAQMMEYIRLNHPLQKIKVVRSPHTIETSVDPEFSNSMEELEEVEME